MQGSFSQEATESALELLKGFTDSGVYEFARCVRPDGSVYGTGGKCRKGTEQAKAVEAKAAPKAAKKSLAERMAAAAERMEKQQHSTPKAQPKAPQEVKTAASRVARPVDPKIAAKVNKAMAAKAAGPGYTPEQLAAQDRFLAKSNAKEKKPKQTPEEKAEQKAVAKYEKAKALADDLQAKHDAIKDRISKETGITAFYAGRGRSLFVAELKKLGIPDGTKLVVLREKAKNLRTPKIVEEERKAQEKARLEQFQNQTREQKREEIQKFLKSGAGKSLEILDQDIKTWTNLVKENPEFRTTTNINGLIAMRALRMKIFLATKEERAQSKKEQEKLLENSPKYSSIPGATKPIPKTTPTRQAKILEKELKAVQSEKAKLSKDNEADRPRLGELVYIEGKLKRQIDDAKGGKSIDPGLPLIYRLQGYNAKPEVVPTRKDLEARTDLAKNPDGRPIIAYRGVTSEEFAHQLRGGGPNGDMHYPGAGIYGNGTYAASAPREKVTHDEWAQKTAIEYAGSGGNASKRVTAFAFRSDANIAQPMDTGSYNLWVQKTMKEAEEKTGFKFDDVGHAAAAMGIHAYRVPQGSEDYWVVLNRGAMIVAIDPQITPRD